MIQRDEMEMGRAIDRMRRLTSVSAVKVTGSWDWIVGLRLYFGPNKRLKVKDIHIRNHFAE